MAKDKAPKTAPVAPTAAAAAPERTSALVATPAAEVPVSKALVEQLMGALIAGREVGKQEADETLFEVVNVSGANVAFPVTDARSGLSRHISLPGRGAKAKITRAQVLEVEEKYPHFFVGGFISASAIVPDGVNIVHDLKKFIADLPNDDVTTGINAITSVGLLFELYNYIENQRFEHQDSDGIPHTEKDGEKDVPVLRELAVAPKLIAVEVAVSRRMLQLAGIKVSIDA